MPRIKFSLLVGLTFALAIFIHILLVNWTLQYGNNGDLTRYEDWARITHEYGLADTYEGDHSSTTLANNQPPGSLYIISGTYEVYILEGKIIARITHTKAGSLLWVNTFLQHATMKIPSLVTDILMGMVIYLLVSRVANKKKGLLAASLVLFNPVILYNSTIWGQMDSLNNFFFILSLFLAYRKNTILSILSCAVSLYIKLSLLPLLPFYFVFLYFISKKNIKRIAIVLFVSAVVIIVATIPVSQNPIEWFITNIPQLSGGELQNMTIAAFNFWWMLLCYPAAGHKHIPTIVQRFFGITLNTWGYLLFGLSTVPVLFLQIKKSQKLILPERTFLLFSVVALCAFLFLPKMHDRYMYPVFPLLAVASVLGKNGKANLIIFFLLSIFNYSNVMYSWFPIVFNSRTVFYHVFYGDTFGWILSICTTIVGIWFYYMVILELKK